VLEKKKINLTTKSFDHYARFALGRVCENRNANRDSTHNACLGENEELRLSTIILDDRLFPSYMNRLVGSPRVPTIIFVRKYNPYLTGHDVLIPSCFIHILAANPRQFSQGRLDKFLVTGDTFCNLFVIKMAVHSNTIRPRPLFTFFFFFF